MNIHAKQISALKLGIKALERERRARFAAGEAAYRQGIRGSSFEGAGVKGTSFAWVDEDHKEYQRYTQAIQEMEDLIEIMESPPATYDDNADLPPLSTEKPCSPG